MPTLTEREIVARAICKQVTGTERRWQTWVSVATAAIQALDTCREEKI